MLSVAFVRSSYAHAKIPLDRREARARRFPAWARVFTATRGQAIKPIRVE